MSKYPNSHIWESYVISSYPSLEEMYPNDTKRVEFFLKHTWHSKSGRMKKKLLEIQEIAQNQDLDSQIPAPPLMNFVT